MGLWARMTRRGSHQHQRPEALPHCLWVCIQPQGGGMGTRKKKKQTYMLHGSPVFLLPSLLLFASLQILSPKLFPIWIPACKSQSFRDRFLGSLTCYNLKADYVISPLKTLCKQTKVLSPKFGTESLAPILLSLPSASSVTMTLSFRQPQISASPNPWSPFLCIWSSVCQG